MYGNETVSGTRSWAVRRWRGLAAIALIGSALAGGCAATEMTSTWVDPAAKGTRMQKLVVIAMTGDEGTRRMAEDRVAANMKTAVVVPSYRALQGVDMKDKGMVTATLREGGYDGALIMRLAGVTEQLSTVPVATFGDYYGWAAPVGYGPGYLESIDTNVMVVSNLYDVKTGKLIWSGSSSTFDPDSTKQVVDEVSKEVAKALEKEQLTY